jgi:hypothetical protein
MKRFSVYALAAVLMILSPALPSEAGTVISGELVVSKGSPNQFRIVDHAGFFQAPRGMMIEALDGKPVIVELSDNRQVLSITEKPIHIDRVESVYESISGELVLVDATRGTFSIAGAPQTYLAPRHVDVRRYAGQPVELFLDQQGRVMQIGFAGPAGAGAQVATGGCSYNGRAYGGGMMLCQTGTQYRCENGAWRSLGTTCRVAGDAPTGPAIFGTNLACAYNGTSYSDGAARCENGVRFICDDGRWQYVNGGCGDDVSIVTSPTDGCSLGGATLAHGSSICRSGVTFRCTGGSWVNVGTACR